MDILTLIKQDHRKVGALLDEAEKCDPGDQRLKSLATEIENLLTAHVTTEEKYFYSEIRDRAEESERVDVYEAYTEHEVARHLIDLLKSGGRRNPEEFKGEFQVLSESVKHHVQEEESKVFTAAKKVLEREDLEELGTKMETAEKRLLTRLQSNGHASPKKKATKKATSRHHG